MRLELVNIGLAVITGYLLGAFLPGYFLPLWLKKMDIRKVGDGNPGVINVYRQAGLFPAVLTGAYDLSKSLLSVYIARVLFKMPPAYAYLAGFSAVLALRFPFYLGFKGGRGIAATISLFMYIFVTILVRDFGPGEALPFLAYIVLYAVLVLVSTHGQGDLLTVSMFPFIGITMLIHLRLSPELVLILVLCALMAVEATRNLVRDGISFPGSKGYAWRSIARLLVSLFIPLGLALPRPTLLVGAGVALGLSGLFDLFRLLIPRLEGLAQSEIVPGFRPCKPEESGRPCSMTMFLLGLGLCLFFFDRNIAWLSLGFVSFSVLLADLVDKNFGKRRLYAKSAKTLEGRLACLGGAVTLAFFFWSGGLLPLHVAGLGALAAVLADLIPSRSGETLAVPLFSGAIMTLF